jgi:SAM-dependent methyltransferase
LRQLPSPPKRILDLGAGYGDFINGAEGGDKWAVDAWANFTQHLSPGVKGLVADIRRPISGLPEKHFDLCFTSNVLEHFSIEEGEMVLEQVKKALRPGGYFVALQPNFPFCVKTYFDDYTHRTIFTHESLANFLSAKGFKVALVRPRYLPFSFKSRLPRSVLLAKLYLSLPWRPMGAQMLVAARWDG